MTTDVNLFSPIKLGPSKLPNRIVMAPMTRLRAGIGSVPVPINGVWWCGSGFVWQAVLGESGFAEAL